MTNDSGDRAELLAGLNVFVGGPIQHAILEDSFFVPLQEAIEAAIGTVRDHGGEVFSAHVVEKFGLDTAAYTPKDVSARDFQWMKACDVFVPVLPALPDGTLYRTDGTHIELGWATALERPVVLITEQPFAEGASHLLKGLNWVGRVQAIDFTTFTENPALLVDAVLAAVRPQREAAEVGMTA
ncbi:hypothetical protein GCM10010174_47950 [Kutzneria viridogrisea]|uniref:Nucleoside 2-deoxyribosyltransferase n=2 Tax=Kutzneria TaxID=43356 RepID=W5WDH0_9PSEU|nr:hypothetical protein [Kutzneria albida]AHH98917.1 hypothetical protein KALB_5555 [Kutzneria albida DSM 43870]MBA8923528.1 hypothetical protein [Kutzneria viridogrisea]